uniref:ParB/Sulfiredoxin domain-containing protein n=1 Tax=Panagrolaimus sp. JU765 TaxID=591449 RepID=A0AC34QSU1_9BILA
MSSWKLENEEAILIEIYPEYILIFTETWKRLQVYFDQIFIKIGENQKAIENALEFSEYIMNLIPNSEMKNYEIIHDEQDFMKESIEEYYDMTFGNMQDEMYLETDEIFENSQILEKSEKKSVSELIAKIQNFKKNLPKFMISKMKLENLESDETIRRIIPNYVEKFIKMMKSGEWNNENNYFVVYKNDQGSDYKIVNGNHRFQAMLAVNNDSKVLEKFDEILVHVYDCQGFLEKYLMATVEDDYDQKEFSLIEKVDQQKFKMIIKKKDVSKTKILACSENYNVETITLFFEKKLMSSWKLENEEAILIEIYPEYILIFTETWKRLQVDFDQIFIKIGENQKAIENALEFSEYIMNLIPNSEIKNYEIIHDEQDFMKDSIEEYYDMTFGNMQDECFLETDEIIENSQIFENSEKKSVSELITEIQNFKKNLPKFMISKVKLENLESDETIRRIIPSYVEKFIKIMKSEEWNNENNYFVVYKNDQGSNYKIINGNHRFQAMLAVNNDSKVLEKFDEILVHVYDCQGFLEKYLMATAEDDYDQKEYSLIEKVGWKR